MAPMLIHANAGTATDHFRNVINLALARTTDFSAVVYQCILNEDNDGAPNCYGPDGSGALDELRYATSDENHVFTANDHNFSWHGLYSRTSPAPANAAFDLDDGDPKLKDRDNKFPVKQKNGNFKGFYVSTTSWIVDGSKKEWDPARYLSAAAFSYGAITPPLQNLGVSLGDLGLAIRPDRQLGKGFFFGDAGVRNKVGEVSRNLFRTFFPRADQETHPVTFIVFPGVAAGTIKGNELDIAVQRQIHKLSGSDSADDLLRFLSFPPHLRGPRAPAPIPDPGPKDNPPTQMQQLREAVMGPHRSSYADHKSVLQQFGL